MYSKPDDIQELLKWIDFSGAFSSITNRELDTFYIPEADKFIDSSIAHRYAVPITHSSDIELLKFISSRLAAYEAASTLILRVAGQLPEIVKEWRLAAMERLQAIIDGQLLLPNSDVVYAGSGLYSHTAHNPDAPARVWKLDGEPW